MAAPFHFSRNLAAELNVMANVSSWHFSASHTSSESLPTTDVGAVEDLSPPSPASSLDYPTGAEPTGAQTREPNQAPWPGFMAELGNLTEPEEWAKISPTRSERVLRGCKKSFQAEVPAKGYIYIYKVPKLLLQGLFSCSVTLF